MGIARKCSYCGKLGHNSRTCKSPLGHGYLKLFGVQLDISSSSSSSTVSFSSPSYSAMTNHFFSLSPSFRDQNQNSDAYLLTANTLLSRIQDTKKGYFSHFICYFYFHLFSGENHVYTSLKSLLSIFDMFIFAFIKWYQRMKLALWEVEICTHFNTVISSLI